MPASKHLLARVLALSALVWACTAPSRSFAPGNAAVALAAPLQALAPLVGGEWVATFPNGMTDTQRFEPMVDGRFLRNVHHVRSADGALVYEGETVYAWDFDTEALRFWYFNATGGWVAGALEPEADGEIAYAGENHAPGGQTERVRGSFRLDAADADRFTSVTWFLRDGAWQVERELVYRRLPGGE